MVEWVFLKPILCLIFSEKRKYKIPPLQHRGKIFNKKLVKGNKINLKFRFFVVVKGSQFYHF